MVNKLIHITDKTFGAAPRYFLPVLLLINLVFHAPYMKLPAVGNHVWRQCNTLAVAKNYAEEGMNLLEPRVDKRFETTGITGPQFPAYDYTLAVLYKAFGFSEYTHRWFSWVLSALGICGMYFLTLRYSANRLYAGIAATFLAFVPELYFHGINAVPDIMALTAMLWGWWFGLAWLRDRGWNTLLPAAILITLAGMVKMQFLVAGVPLLIGFFRSKKRTLKFYSQGAVLAATAAGFTAWWYTYAAILVKKYGLHEFVHAMRHARSSKEMAYILEKTLFSDFPEIFTGYAFLPLILAGAVAAYMSRRAYLPMAFYAAACILFYFLVQYQFIHHGYYAIIFFPALALLAAKGYVVLHRSKAGILVLLIWLAPVWAWARMAQANWTPGNHKVPAEFLSESSRQKMRQYSDTGRRWIVGPDISGCVYFYYTGAKGFPWTDSTEKPELMRGYIRRGASGLITNRPDLIPVCMPQEMSYTEIHREGNFRWYSIGTK